MGAILKFILQNPKSIAIFSAIIISLTIFVTIFEKGRSFQKAEAKSEQAEVIEQNSQDNAKQVERQNNSSKKLQTKLQKHAKLKKIYVKKVEKEIDQNQKIYSSCAIPFTGLQLINDTADAINKSRVSE